MKTKVVYKKIQPIKPKEICINDAFVKTLPISKLGIAEPT